MDDFRNVYADALRARAYADLEFPGTYYLAYRDVPDLLSRHACGRRALDFGCGAGRSTRFLKRHGFEATGVDISDAMLQFARASDPDGHYLLVEPGDLGVLHARQFDVVVSMFTFDNIPTAQREALFTQLRSLLAPNGTIINLVSSPEIYTHEWASFSTSEFPENRDAQSGDTVKTIMLDVEDRRPVEDILRSDADNRATFAAAGLEVIEVHKPLGREADPCEWVSEVSVAPWTIYVLGAGRKELERATGIEPV